MRIDVTTREESKYEYKCPECGGEFNVPYYAALTTACTTGRCPFCGREMAI